MVSIYKTKKKRELNDDIYITTEYRGLSTDTKPITFIDENGKSFKTDNGSVFIEIDTQNVAIYNLENEQWEEE